MLKTFDIYCNCKLFIFQTTNDLLCVQETRWKGEKAKYIGEGYKMLYRGSENKKNGVGIISKKEQVDKVVDMWRVADRIICLKMELDGVMLNVISVYAS